MTPSLTLDVTINPDFAQAEADEQQVNLTQFSLFFPEKREFFLENSGIFYFGDIPRNSASGRSGSVRPKKICCCSSAGASASPPTGEEEPLARRRPTDRTRRPASASA